MPSRYKAGTLAFSHPINDLSLSDNLNAKLWKYVDDTTSSEVVPKGCDGNAQQIAGKVAQWSSDNRVKLNNEKYQELKISFARNQQELQPIVVNGQELEVVHSAKLLGITITSDLSWSDNIGKVLKKASKCLYFLVQLKRVKLPSNDLVLLIYDIHQIYFIVRCTSFLLRAAQVFAE